MLQVLVAGCVPFEAAWGAAFRLVLRSAQPNSALPPSCAGADATGLLAAKLDFTQRRRMAADEVLLLLRAGASMERLPLRLKAFAVELALQERAERAE